MKVSRKFAIKNKRVEAMMPISLWLIGAALYGIIRAFLAETLVLDDTRFWIDFASNYDQSGNMLSALIAVLFNADYMAYTGDFRTYGISRLFHVLIMLITHDNVKVFAFIIGFSHIMSGFLLYNILKHLIINRDCIFFCISIYIFSPFARVQSFHHFTYLMLPFYLLLGFISYELYLSSQKKENILNIKYMLISTFFIIGVVFTGENTLPMLFFALFLMMIREIREHNKNGYIKYLFLMFLECLLFVGYYIIYSNFINRAQNSRFNVGVITIGEGIIDYFKSLFRAFRSFLFLPVKFNPTVESYMTKATFSHFSFWIALCIVVMAVVCLVGIYHFVMKRKQNIEEFQIHKVAWITFLFMLSSSVMCLGLEIFAQSFSQPVRYFYVTLTLVLVFFIITMFAVFQNHAAKIISSLILFVCVGYSVIWCSCIINSTKKSDAEILTFLEQAEAAGVENIVIYNSGYPWTRALNDLNSYKGESAFDWSVMADQFITERYNFRNIIFTSRGMSIYETEEDMLQIYDEKTQQNIILPKESVCFVGVSDVAYSAGNLRELKRDYFLNYEAFSKSADCYGVEYYSAQNGVNTNTNILYKDILLLIDVGNETKPTDGTIPDKPFEESKDNVLNYGYQGTGLVVNSISNETYNFLGDIGDRFLTNRYSTEQMEYKFSGLPTEEALAIVIDGMEWWQYEKKKRVYDLEIITNNRTYWVKNIDTYLLSYFDNSVGAKVPYRLFINLPLNTSEVTIIFHNKENYDVATCNSLGIVKRH